MIIEAVLEAAGRSASWFLGGGGLSCAITADALSIGISMDVFAHARRKDATTRDNGF